MPRPPETPDERAHLVAAAEVWLTLTDKDGKTIEARVLQVDGEAATIERKSDRRRFTVPLERLSEQSVTMLRNWRPDAGAPADAESPTTSIPDDLSKRVYPRSLRELQEGLDSIQSREPPDGFAAEQFKALTNLNIYRFLCGAAPNVELDKELVDATQEAVDACANSGRLSHDLGHNTENCNLGSGYSGLASGPKGMIAERSANNRDRKGHRLYCLNPKMVKTGFGFNAKGGYVGMYAVDESGSNSKEPWGYPGFGLFPVDYFHENGWSLYLPDTAPDADSLEVEVFKLPSRPENHFGMTESIEGEKLPVPFVSTHKNAINFEPRAEPIDQPGIYYIRVRGGGVRVRYLVELFKL